MSAIADAPREHHDRVARVQFGRASDDLARAVWAHHGSEEQGSWKVKIGDLGAISEALGADDELIDLDVAFEEGCNRRRAAAQLP